jgi:hypothetical protein
MSWKSESNRIYEERVVNDSLARLAKRVDVKGLPFSDQELKTLAKRFREAFRGPERKRERLARYKAHLAKSHGAVLVEEVSAALEEINNAIGYEEK